MFENKKSGLGNRGVSLVELLVAIAAGAVVMLIIASFIASGTNYFKKQMNTVNLQNELTEASNKVTDALMEASLITVYESAGTLYIVTGDFDSDSSKSKAREIVWDSSTGHLYVFDFWVEQLSGDADSDLEEGYCVSEYVSDLSIGLNEACLTTVTVTDENGNEQTVYDGGVTNPIVFDVSITVSNNKDTKSDSKTTSVRNVISAFSYSYQGTSYFLNES